MVISIFRNYPQGKAHILHSYLLPGLVDIYTPDPMNLEQMAEYMWGIYVNFLHHKYIWHSF